MMNYIIENALLIDGKSDAIKENASLAIENGEIVSIGQNDSLNDVESFTTIDAGGRAVLPALMDAHAGIASFTHAEGEIGATPENISASILRGVQNGRRYLNVGVTTVRVDTCGHFGIFKLKEAFEKGIVDGPRLFTPGRGIAVTGGHCWDVGAYIADGPDEMRKAAREMIRAGADWVKLMVTGGAGSAGERLEDHQMTFEEINAAVDEAHKRGKPVFAHLSVASAIRDFLKAGGDSVEHGHYLEQDCVETMVKQGTFYVPTLGVYHGLVERGKKGEVPEFMYKKSLAIVDRHRESFKMALKAGVKIVMGTDSGSYWYPCDEASLRELEIFVEEGMSPMEAIRSATSRAAELLGISDRFGTLEIGKQADILIVDGNPLKNMSDLRNTWKVFKEGRIVTDNS